MPEMEGIDDLIQTKTSFAQSLGSVSYNSKRLHARNKSTFQSARNDLSPPKNPNINLGLRERDTFLSIFPGYGITKDRFKAHTSATHFYPDKNDLGEPVQKVNREYHHKLDFMKRYHESMLKVQNMRRIKH